MDSQMSRRAILVGGVALGAAGAASLVTGRQPAAAQALRPSVPIPRDARVGATFNLLPFRKGTTWGRAVDEWNKRTGTQMRCWKVYFQESDFPASIDAQTQTIIDRKIQAMISFKPSRHLSVSERNRLKAAVTMFHKHKLLAEVCLWQEVGPKDMTAAQYHDYVKYYGPVIREFYPLVFDAPGSPGPAEWKAYDPGHKYLDGYALDLYCADFTRKSRRLEPLIELAGELPVGVWEIGNTASNSFFPTAAQLTTYMDYLTSTLSKREAQGLPVGSVAWYDGPGTPKQTGQNEIVGKHPCSLARQDIALYRKLYRAVNQVS